MKNFTKNLRWLLMSLMMIVSVGAWAEDPYYSMTTSSETGTNYSYTGNCDITINGITWNFTGNAQMNPWRLGGKSITSTDRLVYTKTAMGAAISKVDLTVGTASSITVNSLKLTVASDASFSSVIDEVTATFAASSTISFEPSEGKTWDSGAFYKFTFNVTVSGSSNKFVQFSGVDFYEAEDSSDTRIATTTTFPESAYTFNLGETFTSPVATLDPATAGSLTYSSSDEGVATVDASTGEVTIVAAGTTTITASFAGDDNYKASSASYSLTVAVTYTSIQQLQENVTSTATDINFEMTDIYVTAVGGTSNNQAWISDGTYGALIYTSGHGLSAGQKINGTLTGAKLVLFRGQTEITNFSSTGLTITEDPLAPQVKTIDQLSGANQSLLVTLENVTYDGSVLSDGTNSITPYTTFMSSLGLESGKTYNITGIVILYNSTLEIAPRTSDDIVELNAKLDPEIYFSEANVTATLGQTFTAPTFNNPYNLPVTFTSSDLEVATVDETTGEVTILTEGTTFITATFAGDDTYEEKSVSYSLVVEDPRTETYIVFWQGETKYPSESTFTITVGDDFTSPEAWAALNEYATLTHENGPITYAGDNDDLATVNPGNGALTFVEGATGTISVTATYNGDEQYKPCTGFYTLTVNPATTPVTGDELFNETFAGFESTGGRDGSYTGSVGNGSTATGTDEEDWTFEKCGAASSSLKFGTSSANGVFTTRTIALSGDGVLTFSVAGWGSGTNTLSVTATGGTLSGDTDITLTNGEWTDYTVNITGATGELVLTFTGKRGFIDDIKVIATTTDERTATTTTFDGEETYNITLGDEFTAPTATLDPATAGTLTYASSNESVATVNASTGEVTIVAAGTTTITASFAGNDSFKPSSDSYTINVTDPNANDGSQDHPYTVAEARAAIDANTGTTGVYATGIVSEIVTAYNSQYGNITYNISDDGSTTSDQLQAYRGKSYNGENFSSEDDIQVGDVVVIYGDLTKYNAIYEFAANNQLVSLERPAVAVEAPVFSPAGGTYTEDQVVTITCATENTYIYYTLDGSDPDDTSTPYEGPITITETTTVKAIAYDDSDVPSSITEATYTINKPDVPTAKEINSDYWVKVTDLSQIEEGDAVLIVNEIGKDNESYALGEKQTNNYYGTTVNWIPGWNIIDGTSETVTKVIVAQEESYYYFYDSANNGYLKMRGSNSNGLQTETTKSDNSKAAITIDENGDASIVFAATGRNTLRFNTNGTNNALFACYASGQNPVQLYVEVPRPNVETVTLTEATDNYKTIVAPYDLDLTSAEIETFIVVLNDAQDEAELVKVTKVPAATPVIVHNNTSGTYELTKADQDTMDDVDANVLMVSRGNVEGDYDETTGEATIYVLNKVDGTLGFYPLNAGKTLVAGKCYILLENASGIKMIGLNNDDTTGINAVANDAIIDTDFYNLAGQRVINPTKGIYIVNGKKVLIK